MHYLVFLKASTKMINSSFCNKDCNLITLVKSLQNNLLTLFLSRPDGGGAYSLYFTRANIGAIDVYFFLFRLVRLEFPLDEYEYFLNDLFSYLQRKIEYIDEVDVAKFFYLVCYLRVKQQGIHQVIKNILELLSRNIDLYYADNLGRVIAGLTLNPDYTTTEIKQSLIVALKNYRSHNDNPLTDAELKLLDRSLQFEMVPEFVIPMIRKFKFEKYPINYHKMKRYIYILEMLRSPRFE